jgi:hypothetical protein
MIGDEPSDEQKLSTKLHGQLAGQLVKDLFRSPPTPTAAPAAKAPVPSAAKLPPEVAAEAAALYAELMRSAPGYKKTSLLPYLPASESLQSSLFLVNGGLDMFSRLHTDEEQAAALTHIAAYQTTSAYLHLTQMDTELHAQLASGFTASLDLAERLFALRSRLAERLDASVRLMKSLRQPGGLKLNISNAPGGQQQVNLGTKAAACPPTAGAAAAPADDERYGFN